MRWTLVDRKTREAISFPVERKNFRGGFSVITGGNPPHKPSSTGRVHTQDNRELYPSVFDLVWVRRHCLICDVNITDYDSESQSYLHSCYSCFTLRLNGPRHSCDEITSYHMTPVFAGGVHIGWQCEGPQCGYYIGARKK